MAKAEKKVLGLLPRCLSTTLLLGLIGVVVLALIWSWVMVQSFSTDNAWVQIIELIVLAILVGLMVGLLANNANPVTLWVAAGLTVLAVVLAQGLMAYSQAGLDVALLGSLGEEAFSPSVSVGAVVLGIIAAACAAMGARSRDVLVK